MDFMELMVDPYESESIWFGEVDLELFFVDLELLPKQLVTHVVLARWDKM
jgi:hypothetical protein